MKHLFLTIMLLSSTLAQVPVARAAEFNTGYIISDQDMVNKDTMSRDDIQSFLDAKGTLGQRLVEDLDGQEKPVADIIYRVSQEFLINPRFILVMLQKEQSLITDPDPSQRQLDWAVGYAVCDGCYLNSDSVSRFRGFAKQIDSMAQQFRFGYLEDLRIYGATQTGIRVGEETVINDEVVVPENNATASLYTYTPHLHGNRNFWLIYNDWFSHPEYPSGTILKDVSDDSLWLIKYGKRRQIRSQTVLQSFYNPDQVITVDAAVLSDYAIGPEIAFPNYSLVRTPNGDVYLIVNDQKRRFVSSSDLAKFGYAEDEILDAAASDLSGYDAGALISFDTAYPQGAVLEHPDTGVLYYVDGGKRHTIVSEEIRAARFGAWRIRSTTVEELASYPEGAAVQLTDGTLMMVEGNPTVYVVSDGKRRPIIDEGTFLGLGFTWDRIQVVSRATVEVHPPGELISL